MLGCLIVRIYAAMCADDRGWKSFSKATITSVLRTKPSPDLQACQPLVWEGRQGLIVKLCLQRNLDYVSVNPAWAGVQLPTLTMTLMLMGEFQSCRDRSLLGLLSVVLVYVLCILKLDMTAKPCAIHG